MKTIAFVFEKQEEYLPQIEWCISEYIQPYVHQILLVFLLPEKWFPINDPGAMLMCAGVCNFEQMSRRKLVKTFFSDIENIIINEFNKDIQITKMVICGDDRYKLKACLSSLEVDLVVLGPDTVQNRISSLLFKPLDNYISEDIRVPVLRIPNLHKLNKKNC